MARVGLLNEQIAAGPNRVSRSATGSITGKLTPGWS